MFTVVVSFPTAFLRMRGGGITSNVTPDGMDRGAPPIFEFVLGDVLNCLGAARGCRPGRREVKGFSKALREHCRQRHLVLGNMAGIGLKTGLGTWNLNYADGLCQRKYT